jgi:hypothetical protein
MVKSVSFGGLAYEDLVDLLLDKGADPNAEGGSTALTSARPHRRLYR